MPKLGAKLLRALFHEGSCSPEQDYNDTSFRCLPADCFAAAARQELNRERGSNIITSVYACFDEQFRGDEGYELARALFELFVPPPSSQPTSSQVP